jgi:hypothetical protein
MSTVALEERKPGLVQSSASVYTISEESPAFAFAEGLSRFLALELPAGAAGRQLVIHSGFSGVTSRCRTPTSPVGGFRAVSPRVVFLDERKRPLGVSAKPSLRLSTTYETLQFVAVVPDQARFFLVYSDPETFGQLIGGVETRPTMVPLAGTPGVVAPIGGGMKRFVSTVTGTLNIWVDASDSPVAAKPAAGTPRRP